MWELTQQVEYIGCACALTFPLSKIKLIGYGYVYDIQAAQQKKEAETRFPDPDELSRGAPGDQSEKVEGSKTPLGLGAEASMASHFQRLLLLLVKGYRYAVSPLLPPSCRFTPTCSAYCEEALRRHGSLMGLWLALMRVLKCHPFHPGGHDPVR